MKLNNMSIQQDNNEYRIHTKQGQLIAHIIMPKDGKFLADYKVLEAFCKVLALRWCFTEQGEEKGWVNYAKD